MMPAKSPVDQLKEWTDKLVADQSQNTDLAKEIDRLKNQIADLSKTVSDIDLKKQAWTNSIQAANQQQADLAAYVKTKTTMLKATVADPKTISDAKDEAMKELGDLQDVLDKANKAPAEKQEDWVKAKDAAADAANSYSTYASLAAANDAILKDLTSVRASADKEGAANNVARMYFLVLVMTDLLNKINLPAPDDYTTELNNRASALSTTSQNEKLAKIAADKAAADATQAQKALDEARASWRQKVLELYSQRRCGRSGPGSRSSPGASTCRRVMTRSTFSRCLRAAFIGRTHAFSRADNRDERAGDASHRDLWRASGRAAGCSLKRRGGRRGSCRGHGAARGTRRLDGA